MPNITWLIILLLPLLPIVDKLAIYKSLVTRYHQTLDLVSEVALEHFEIKLAESLTYVRAIQEFLPEQGTILDVGSGAGLPGIVLGVHLPHHKIILVERRQKRAAFLKIVTSQLELSNTQVFNTDVTDFKDLQVNVVTAMAVGSFSLLYCLTRHLHTQNVLLVSKKGLNYQPELDILRDTVGLEPDFYHALPLETDFSSSPNIVSRETIYANLVSVRLPGGRECKNV